MVKEETPQDEREILVQMEAHGGLCEVKYYTVCTYSATVQELKKKMEAIRSAKDCLDGLMKFLLSLYVKASARVSKAVLGRFMYMGPVINSCRRTRSYEPDKPERLPTWPSRLHSSIFNNNIHI